MIEPHSETWKAVQEWAEHERSEYVRLLIAAENEEFRGRIKQLDALLSLPTAGRR